MATHKQFLKRLETLIKRQAKLRDDIRELAGEVDDHYENANEAHDALESAADAVSRLV